MDPKKLDVDFIGGGQRMTDEDFARISAWIKEQQEKEAAKKERATQRAVRAAERKKVGAQAG